MSAPRRASHSEPSRIGSPRMRLMASWARNPGTSTPAVEGATPAATFVSTPYSPAEANTKPAAATPAMRTATTSESMYASVRSRLTGRLADGDPTSGTCKFTADGCFIVLLLWTLCRQDGRQIRGPGAYSLPITMIALTPKAQGDAQAKLEPIAKRGHFADIERPGKQALAERPHQRAHLHLRAAFRQRAADGFGHTSGGTGPAGIGDQNFVVPRRCLFMLTSVPK